MTSEQTQLVILVLNIIIVIAGMVINFLKQQQTQNTVNRMYDSNRQLLIRIDKQTGIIITNIQAPNKGIKQ